jgi:hypothetical protein
MIRNAKAQLEYEHGGGIEGFPAVDVAGKLATLTHREKTDAAIGAQGNHRSACGCRAQVRSGTARARSSTSFYTRTGETRLRCAPPPHPAGQRTFKVPIDRKILNNDLESYPPAPNFILAVTREGDHVLSQATGAGMVEVFPETDHEFLLKEWTPRSHSKPTAREKPPALSCTGPGTTRLAVLNTFIDYANCRRSPSGQIVNRTLKTCPAARW